MIEYSIDTYRKWLSENVKLSNAFSPESLRELTFHVLMGRNYRLLTEANTKDKLFTTYMWLSDVFESAKSIHGKNWQVELLKDLQSKKRTPEQKDLVHWLLGTTTKGAVNLGIPKEDYPNVLSEMIDHCTQLFQNLGRPDQIDRAWLFMMAGSATLNIRGSEKSSIGKKLEKVFIRALLTILGFEQETNFWVNIQRDKEVEREADAEIKTKRGRLRIEVGLIAEGNQEVVEDKIGRVGRNGIILFDKIGTKSRIHDTAVNAMVKLIQIRGNQPLVEVHRHVKDLVDFKLNEPPVLEKDLKKVIDALPVSIFTIEKNDAKSKKVARPVKKAIRTKGK